jgi:hypothetical protein
LQLTPNSSFQSIRGTVLAAGGVPQRWRSALLAAAEPHIRYTAWRSYSKISHPAGRGEVPNYRILKNDSGDVRAVKIGFSWPAMILNLVWLIANGLWLGALLVFVLIVSGLLVFSSALQESPIAASGLFVAGEIALLFFLGLRGNDWLASHLESRGYHHAQSLEAKGFAEALELAAPDHHAV